MEKITVYIEGGAVQAVENNLLGVEVQILDADNARELPINIPSDHYLDHHHQLYVKEDGTWYHVSTW